MGLGKKETQQRQGLVSASMDTAGWTRGHEDLHELLAQVSLSSFPPPSQQPSQSKKGRGSESEGHAPWVGTA